jgi:intein/homing endonuclease
LRWRKNMHSSQAKSRRTMSLNTIIPRWNNLQQAEYARNQEELAKTQKLTEDPTDFFRHVLGFEPTTYQQELIKLFQENQFIAARWSRQCVDGETLVFLDNGMIEPIKTLKGSWFTGIQRVYRVVSSSGKELICTQDHKFYTKKGWKKLKDISIDDEVFVQDQIPIFGTLQISDERVKILAYLITDGSFKSQKQSIKFTGKAPYITEFVEAIKREFDDINPKLYKKGNCLDVLCTAKRSGRTVVLSTPKRGERRGVGFKVKMQPNSLQVWMRSLEFIGNIPRIAFELKRQQLALFLNRLYAADGWISIWKSARNRLGIGKNVEVGFGSPSKQDAVGLQMQLLKFGVHARIRAEYPTSHSKRKKPIFHVFYRVLIGDIYSIKRFFDEIGFIFGKEIQSQEAYHIVKNRIEAIEEGKCPKVTRLGPYTAKKDSGTK